MAPSLQVILFLSCVLFQLSSSALAPQQQQQQQAVKGQAVNGSVKGQPEPVAEETWAPATQPREFSYKILDGIKGASQMRHEKWENGTVRGMYATPLPDGKFTVVHYLADKNGFQILSSKTMSEAELMHNEVPEKDNVKVSTDVDGSQSNYKISSEEIAQRQKLIDLQAAQQVSRLGRGLESGEESEEDKQKKLYEAEARKILDFLSKKVNGTAAVQPLNANAAKTSS